MKKPYSYFAFRFLIPGIFCLAFSSGSIAQAFLFPTSLECKLLQPVMHGFVTNHVAMQKLDSTLEARTIDQYIKRLDPSKIYLLESDVQEIKKDLSGLFEKISHGDCAALFKTQEILNHRIDESLDNAKKILDNSFKFDEKTEILLDPQKRSYAKNQQESSEQFKKFIQFQISNYLASDMKLPQAKKQLLHRYELNKKRSHELKTDDILSGFLDSFASSLDAHSSYLSQDVLEDFEISMRLSLEGIGTSLSWEDGYTTIESLVPGGAAERSGEVKPKDKIVAVGQGPSGESEAVIDTPLRDVVKLIRGKKGTIVRLTLLRRSGGSSSTVRVSLKRETINLKEDAARLSTVTKKIQGKDYKIGILELPSFYGDLSQGSRSCYEDTKKLVDQARREKLDGLILDLSKNGGGLLTEAVRIGGLFLKRGNIVATQDAKGHLDLLSDEDDTVNFSGPLVVVISRLSASASEIVAGALQDYKRALIVGGDHTFGKGTVQAVSNLPKGLGAIKVTTGMFFIPGGASTQHRGVTADVSMPSPFSMKDIGEKALDYSLPPKSVKGFLSAEAQSTTEDSKWIPISKDLVESLKLSSADRVKKEKEFEKIRKEVEEAESKDGVIKLSDALKKQKDTKKERDELKATRGRLNDQKYLDQPQIQESVHIMMDELAYLTSHKNH